MGGTNADASANVFVVRSDGSANFAGKLQSKNSSDIAELAYHKYRFWKRMEQMPML